MTVAVLWLHDLYAGDFAGVHIEGVVRLAGFGVGIVVI